jgi:hypothetical protein
VFFSFVYDDLGVSLWVIMGEKIYIITAAITLLVGILQLIIAIKVARMYNCPSSLTYFYLYPLVGTIINIVICCNFLNFIPHKVSLTINILSLLFHYSFLSNFIYRETGKQIVIKYLSISIFFLLILFIILDIKILSAYSFAFTNSCLFIFCIYYFYLLLKEKPALNLANNPAFIICCGIFIGVGISIPFTLAYKYLVELNVPRDTRYVYNTFAGLGYILMNLSFIKALLCIKPNT